MVEKIVLILIKKNLFSTWHIAEHIDIFNQIMSIIRFAN